MFQTSSPFQVETYMIGLSGSKTTEEARVASGIVLRSSTLSLVRT